MAFDLPFPGPYQSTTYPVALAYDVSGDEPADWHLRMTVGVTATATLALRAVCSGTLSTVPPDELPPSWYGLITTPSGQTFTEPISLYLQPLASVVAEAGLVEALTAAHLGSEVRWFVYENVDPATVATILAPALNSDPNLETVLLNGGALTSAQRLEVFFNGEATATVTGGSVIGQAAPIAGAGTQIRGRFGVQTDTGYVDPVAFFDAILNFLSPAAQADIGTLTSLILTPWPILFGAGTASELIRETSLRLYPLPVLAEAKERIGLSTADWRTVGDGQKALYWERLYNVSTAAAQGAFFSYNLDDMVNPFQLEAVAEFFVAWPQSTGSTSPPPALPPSPALVDFLKADITIPQQGDGPQPTMTTRPHAWDIVIIDSFSHPLLGTPDLPKPDFTIAGYSPTGGQCSPQGPVKNATTNTYPNPDLYTGVLFLVHKGRVDRWYRWSTLTSCRWEDTAHGSCELASSILGNQVYFFRSRTAQGAPLINYALALWDGDVTRNSSGNGSQPPSFNDLWVPGKYYLRTGLPSDTNGKTHVLIHTGRTTDHLNTTESTTGSAGCLVSPQFYALRNRMIALYQQDQKMASGVKDQELAPLEGRSKPDSEAIYNQARGWWPGDLWSQATGQSVADSQWDNKIQGQAYVIRPDEATQR